MKGICLMKKHTFKKLIAFLLAAVMTVSSVPLTAFAAEEPVLLLQQVDETYLTDGMFYFASAGAEIGEADPDTYRLFVKRNGTDLPEASVRVTMLDMTASYGKDYKVSAEGGNLFTGGVKNKNAASSIKDYMLENADAVTEYNYSDAIIDGTITAENQMSDEEIENLEVSEEQKAEVQQAAQDMAEFLLSGSVSVDTAAVASPSVVTKPEKDTAAENAEAEEVAETVEIAEAVEAAEASEVTAAAESSESTSLGTPDKPASAAGGFASLAEAKEYATGLKDDRQEMAMPAGSSPLSIIDDLSSQSAGYMDNSIKAVSDALSSAYVVLTFAEGETEKYIDIRTIDNHAGEGDKQSGFNLSSENGAPVSGVYGNFTLKIIDDEEYEPAVVEFSGETYYPENGYITVTVKRSANTNALASVMLDTFDDTARNTRDYSKVHAKVIFGFGITERTVKIPVVSGHLSEDASFKLLLQEPVNCVVGERNEAAGIIRKTDASFRPEPAGTSDADLLSAAETSDTPLLSAGINLRSIIVGDRSEDLPGTVYDSGVNESDCYSRSYNGGWQLYSESSWYDGVKSWAYFEMPEMHYDYSGLQVEWSRTCGKPSYGYALFEFYNHETGKWSDLYYSTRERWDMQKENYFFEHGAVRCGYYGFVNSRDGGWTAKSPTMTIKAVRPIYRPFEIRLAGSAPVEYIAPDGTVKKNTEIPGLTSENITILKNSNNNTLVTNTNRQGGGNYITVSLSDAAKGTYIYGLELVSWDGSRSRTVLSGYGESTRSISLEFNNSLIARNSDLIDFRDNGSQGDYGRFQVRAILRQKTATLRVKNSDLATVRLEGGNKTTKQGTVRGDYTEYSFHVGDTAIYHVAMKDLYAGNHTWTQINITGEIPPADTIGLIRIGDGDSVKAMLEASVTRAVTIFTEKNNKLTVRVKKEDVGKFQNTGIFTAEREIYGDYYDYIIDRDGNGSDSHIAGKRYVLSATPKDGYGTAVWNEQFVSGVKFMQNDFCFEGTEKIDENTLFLTAEKPSRVNYSLTGTACYSDASLDGNVSADHWYKATGVSVIVDNEHFGISDNNGNMRTVAFPGKEGYYVRYRICAFGDEIIRTVRLGSQSDISLGTFLLNPSATDRVHFNTVTAMQRVGTYEKTVSINSDLTALTATLQLNDPLTGKPYEYTYTDKNGKTQTAVEHVTEVRFVVVDPITRKEKGTFAAKQDEMDPSRWTYAGAFESGHYDLYHGGDLIYVKMFTDRITGTLDTVFEEDDGGRVCEYALINTGITFLEPTPQEPKLVDIKFPVYEYYDLPIIGDLSTFVDALGLSFGVTQTEEGGVRIFFGKQIKPKNSHFDGNGKITSDNGIYYGIKDITSAGSMISEMSDMVNTFGSKNMLGAMSLGIPAWSIEPFAGVYFEFAMCVDTTGQADYLYLFTGGGGYIGAMGSFRYTYYMVIYGIPVYVGGDVSLTLVGEFGVAPDEGKTIAFNDPDPDQKFFDDLLKNTHFEFIFEAMLDANAYAGVGICGTLGIRGGFSLTLAFIYNPTIRKSYPQMRQVGFAVTGAIKFWVDAILLSIPIPVYTWDDWCQMGYFEDLRNMEEERERKEKEREYGGTGLLSAMSGAVIAKKSRSEEASQFEGNEPPEEVQNSVSGGEMMDISLLAAAGDHGTDSVHEAGLKEQTIVKNGFDDPRQRLLNFTSCGKEKVLMAYLDDNAEKTDDERTELRISVYDIDAETWSEPMTVQEDGTADFSPAVCDAGDKIFLTWVSRKEKLENDASYEDYLKSLDIFFAEFDKETLTLSDPVQLTDDRYYDTTPNIMYDTATKQAVVTYYKSEVPQIHTPDDLLKAAAPELNNCELVYMLYEDGKWVRDKIYPGELADDVDPAPLLKAFEGQRFVNSALLGAGMNNPVVGDAVAATVGMYTYDREMLEKKRQEAAELPEEQREALRTETEKAILDSEKNMAVLCYSVDMDQNLSTGSDREVFVQTYDFAKHDAGMPVRITNDTVNDSLPQITASGGKSYLFWLSDGKELRYIDLTELLMDSENGEYTGVPSAAGVKMTPGTMFDPVTGEEGEAPEGVSVNNYRVFSQKNTLYVAWQEQSDAEAQGDFSQDIYVSGLRLDDSKGTDGAIRGGSWSDGIRMTENGKVNEIPEFASISEDDDIVMMVSNRFSMTAAEDGAPYETQDVELISTLYTPQAQMDMKSLTVETYPEKIGDDFTMTFGFQNTGLKAAEGFLYMGYMKDEGGNVVDVISGESNGTVLPGGTEFITVDTILGDEKGSLYLMTSPKGSQVLSYDEFCIFEDSGITLSDVKAVQKGNEFKITGVINNRSVKQTGTEKIRIYDTFGAKTLDASFAAPVVEPGMSGPFEIFVPADPELSRYGYQDMLLSLQDESGKRLCDYENIRARLKSALDIRVNDVADGGLLSVAENEKLSLAVSYTPQTYYRNGSGIFSTEDPEIAVVKDGKLLGVSEGTTTLHVTIDPYGGESAFTVAVGEAAAGSYAAGQGTSSVLSGPQGALHMTGRWQQQTDGSWKFLNSNGTVFTGWGYISTANGWDYYHMRADGTMDHGWYFDEKLKKWYYLNENHDGRFGAMTRGWHPDPGDGKWYYLDPKTGEMCTGWVFVNGKWYYLSCGSNVPVWMQNDKGEWVYSGTGRAMGSMYAGEKTPDGYTVDANGAWTEN